MQQSSIRTRPWRYRLWPGLLLLMLLSSCILLGTLTAYWALDHARAFTNEVEQAEQALTAINKNPTQAMAQAQTHLIAARAELEALRPVAEPALGVTARLEALPGAGTPARQMQALWRMADSASQGGLALTQAADLALPHLNQSPAQLVTAAPAIQQQLNIAQENLVAAQAARNQLDGTDWLPADMSAKTETFLVRWDENVPSLLAALLVANQMLANVDIERSWDHLQTLSSEAEQLAILLAQEQQPGLETLHAAQPHFITANKAFQALQPDIEPVIAQADKLAQVADLNLPAGQIDAWWRFAKAAGQTGEALSVAVDLTTLNSKEAGVAGISAALPLIRDQLQTIELHFKQAQLARSQVQEITWLPEQLAGPLNQALRQWDTVAPLLEEKLPKAITVARALPLLTGYEEPVTYLLLLQSSDELRATGGFIGSIGLIRLENGKISSVNVGEINEFDNQPHLANGQMAAWINPPAPLSRYMGLGHWFLRDANWWADFPTSAQQARDFWRVNNNDQPVDGVIAITDQGIEYLLQTIGPVDSLDGQLVSAQTLKEFAAARIYGDETNTNGRDNQSKLVEEMALVFIFLTQDLSADRLLQLAQYFPEATARRDLLIASFDPPVAAMLNQLSVDGALGGLEDDYFYLVESNVSYNKLSPFIRFDMQYEVELAANGWPDSSSLIVDEMNAYLPGAGLVDYPDGYYDGGLWNSQTRRVDRWVGYYGGYTRLYTPPDSNFLAATGFDRGPDTVTENNRTVIGGYVGLRSGEHRQLQYKWTPNGRPSQPGLYRLHVQRQPGAPKHALSVMVHLPDGYEATEIVPTPIAATQDSVTWNAVLDRDQIFSLQLVATESVTAAVAAPSPSVAATSSLSVTGSLPAVPPPVAPAPAPAPGRAPLPVWINIPAIGVNAPVVSVGLEPSGIMASPSEAEQVGWYNLGPRPGEPSNAVLAGHVDWLGEIGVFSQLDQLQPGDTVEVHSGPETSHRYVVESIASYRADTAPVAEIFGATSEPILTLITCGGAYDPLRQEYRDRLVIRARGVD